MTEEAPAEKIDRLMNEIRTGLTELAQPEKPEDEPTAKPAWESFEELDEMLMTDVNPDREGCPKCGSTVVGLDSDYMNPSLPRDPTVQHMECQECGHKWVEFFVFVGLDFSSP